MTESQRKNAESQRKMTDREKVIRALDCLSRNAQDGLCNGCAYFRPFTDDPDTGWCDRTAAMADALALLQEQEPVKPELRMTKHGFRQWLVCGYCHEDMHVGYNYCPRCGKAAKWE